MTGFLEEAPGVKSSTRLLAVILAGCVVVLVGSLCWYLLRPKMAPDAAVVASIAGVIGALVLNGIVAIVKRSNGDQ